MAQTDAQKRATNKYNMKCKQFHAKYFAYENIESDALTKYLKDNSLTANTYLKDLVRKDLKERGYLDAKY